MSGPTGQGRVVSGSPSDVHSQVRTTIVAGSPAVGLFGVIVHVSAGPFAAAAVGARMTTVAARIASDLTY